MGDVLKLSILHDVLTPLIQNHQIVNARPNNSPSFAPIHSSSLFHATLSHLDPGKVSANPPPFLPFYNTIPKMVLRYSSVSPSATPGTPSRSSSHYPYSRNPISTNFGYTPRLSPHLADTPHALRGGGEKNFTLSSVMSEMTAV